MIDKKSADKTLQGEMWICPQIQKLNCTLKGWRCPRLVMINNNNLVGDHYANAGFEKYFRSPHSFIHSFIYSCTRVQDAKNRPEFLALKGLHSIGKVDSQLTDNHWIMW